MTKMTLINGDCLESLKNIPDNSTNLMLTDPPYNLGNFMRTRDTNLVKMRSNFFGDAGWDDLDTDEWITSMTRLFEQTYRILKPGGSVLMFMSLIKVESLIKIASQCGFYYKTTGIWHKTNPMPRNMNLHFVNSVEGWLYFIKDKKTGTFNNVGAIHDFVESSVTPGREKRYGAHPTQKPEKVIEHFITLLSNPDDVVIDPFMGSGTTGVVAKRLGRSFIGIELQESYFNICLNRIADEQVACEEQVLDQDGNERIC